MPHRFLVTNRSACGKGQWFGGSRNCEEGSNTGMCCTFFGDFEIFVKD